MNIPTLKSDALLLLTAAIPILYGGVLSVGVAYTLQVVAQRKAHPAHTAIFLSMEAVFAAVGGWLILSETLTHRGLVGCSLMLSGMLLSQLYGIYKGRTELTLKKEAVYKYWLNLKKNYNNRNSSAAKSQSHKEEGR